VRSLHVVVPDGVDDPRRPSGGNAYDRRICQELAAMGWAVTVHAVRGSWPVAEPSGHAALADEIGAMPDGAVVLLDGLVASAASRVLLPHASRLRYIALVHLPLGHDGTAEARRSEGAVLAGAASVVVTSRWTRSLLLRLYGLPAARVAVAEPGVDVAPVAPGSAGGGRLLSVAAVMRAKGHDVLVEALSSLADLSWTCACVGSLDRDPTFAARMRAVVDGGGLAGRVRLTGACSDAELDRLFQSADVLVHPSRSETYGMVVTEALARGLPVIASAVGGVPEALGGASAGVPGLLVPPGDAEALGGALRSWLGDSALRRRLREAALERRGRLTPWSATAAVVAAACEAAAR
jgi:glycosyltransferase involved in cell wall biosynthesis